MELTEKIEGLQRTLRDLKTCGSEDAALLLRAVRRLLTEWSEEPGDLGARATAVLRGLGSGT